MGRQARILAQVLVVGGTIVVKAFGEAYQKALINAAKNGGAEGAKKTEKAARMIKGMTVTEAQSILGVTPQTGLTQIVAKADKMFENNAKDKGGSIYLQSKVLNAKDCLSIHLGEEIQENPMEPKTAASEAGDSDTDNKPQP